MMRLDFAKRHLDYSVLWRVCCETISQIEARETEGLDHLVDASLNGLHLSRAENVLAITALRMPGLCLGDISALLQDESWVECLTR